MSALIEIDRISGMVRDTRIPESIAMLPPEQWQPASDDGLLLAADSEPQADFARARLIAIEFGEFHDGRGLSLAVLLRSRYDYQGELRAIGDVRPELIHYLRRCGFDSFVLAEGQTLHADDDRLAPYSDYYQASIAETRPAFRRCRRGASSQGSSSPSS